MNTDRAYQGSAMWLRQARRARKASIHTMTNWFRNYVSMKSRKATMTMEKKWKLHAHVIERKLKKKKGQDNDFTLIAL